MLRMRGHLLPIQKIHFRHMQQYDENHCIYLARRERHSEKSRRKHSSIELFISA